MAGVGQCGEPGLFDRVEGVGQEAESVGEFVWVAVEDVPVGVEVDRQEAGGGAAFVGEAGDASAESVAEGVRGLDELGADDGGLERGERSAGEVESEPDGGGLAGGREDVVGAVRACGGDELGGYPAGGGSCAWVTGWEGVEGGVVGEVFEVFPETGVLMDTGLHDELDRINEPGDMRQQSGEVHGVVPAKAGLEDHQSHRRHSNGGGDGSSMGRWVGGRCVRLFRIGAGH